MAAPPPGSKHNQLHVPSNTSQQFSASPSYTPMHGTSPCCFSSPRYPGGLIKTRPLPICSPCPQPLTLHTAVCRMASKPPSGASRLPEMRSFLSSSLKWLMLLVRRMTFLKEKGESALFQGSRSLGESRRAKGCSSKALLAQRPEA